MRRSMAVLRAVIDEYVETCAPVGSKAIVDNYPLGVSAATVRGDLSRLEGSGHLTQPHVSAGRVPTDLGYRAVVNDDLATGVPRSLDVLHVHAASVAEAMRQIAVALADMTHCLAIVSSPVAQGASVARISLVPTSSGRAVLVVVCDDGRVDSRPVNVGGLSAQEVAGVEQALCNLFVGRDVRQIDPTRVSLGGHADVLLGHLAARVCALVSRSVDGTRASAGVPLLLAQPEFHDADRVRVVVGALEDDDIDFDDLLCDEQGGLVVRIGAENPDERLSDVSFVAKEYQAGPGMGFVACVGPTRMDYRMAIGAVQAGAAEAVAVYAGMDR